MLKNASPIKQISTPILGIIAALLVLLAALFAMVFLPSIYPRSYPLFLSPTATVTWEEYTNKTFGFSFKNPGGWYIDKKDEKNGVILLSDKWIKGIWDYDILADDAPVSIIASDSENARFDPRQLPETKVLEVKDILIDGFPSRFLRYTSTMLAYRAGQQIWISCHCLPNNKYLLISANEIPYKRGDKFDADNFIAKFLPTIRIQSAKGRTY